MTATGLACPCWRYRMILFLRRFFTRDPRLSPSPKTRTLTPRRETALVNDLPGTAAHPRKFAHFPLVTQTRLGAMLKGAVTHRAPPFFGLCYVPTQPDSFVSFSLSLARMGHGKRWIIHRNLTLLRCQGRRCSRVLWSFRSNSPK